ncbi:MAG: hypothetical protein ABSF57_09215 [Acidobacteriaceae bacterium]|jgi:hypothetical protein
MDLCSLPTPHRIPQCVAGMAFNFSRIELSAPASQLNAATPEESQADPAASAREESRRPCFEIPQCSPAS